MIPVLRVFFLMVVLIWPATGTAEHPLNDFAYGFRIAAPEKTGLVKLVLPEASDRYGKLDIDNRQSGLGSSVPELMLGGRLLELFFIVERGGAYVLAYGSRKAAPSVPPPELVEKVAMQGGQAPVAGMGPRMALGGPSR